MSQRKGILRPLSGLRIPPPRHHHPQGRLSWLQELGGKKQTHGKHKADRQAGRGWGVGTGMGGERREKRKVTGNH